MSAGAPPQPQTERRTSAAPLGRAALRALRLAQRHGGLLLLGAGAIVLGTPVAMVELGTAQARACFARYEAPRGPERPNCLDELHWFVRPSRVPWTLTTARYRGEELMARAPVADYLDAAIGEPSRDELARAGKRVDAAEDQVEHGSKRLSLDELGPSIGAPALGKLAESVGDRDTLLGRGERWTSWPVRVHALEAALLEGDVDRAGALAKRYADWDPRDQEVRVDVAAVLCLGADPKRGLGLLDLVEHERATERHEGFTRNFGDVRVLREACAAVAGVAPPALPHEETGHADRPEALAALRLALAPKGPSPARDAAEHLLRGAIPSPGGRAALLAELLAHGYEGSADDVAKLASAPDGAEEPSLALSAPITPGELFDEEPRDVHPEARVEALFDATDTLVALAGGAGLSDATVATLRHAAGAMLLEAGAALARSGKGRDAEHAMRLGGELALADPVAQVLARSTALWMGGDPQGALSALAEQTIAPASQPGPLAAVRAAALVQRAQLLASIGRRGEAARAALEADRAAASAGDPVVDVRAELTRLALARSAGPTLRDPGLFASGAKLVPVGFADRSMRWAGPGGASARALAETLAWWDQAVTAPLFERRARRYEAFHARGDEAPARIAALALAAQLLPADEGDTELWLDAFDAVDGRRVLLRARAFTRAEAARWRGSARDADTWRRRFTELAAVRRDPARAAIASILGI